jgi:hypothetical protein
MFSISELLQNKKQEQKAKNEEREKRKRKPAKP